MTKFKKIFLGVMSNIIIAVFVIFTFLPFGGYEKEVIKNTANSEYNGTIYAGDKSSKKVSLMINVYWGNEHLEKMLDILKKHKVKTTFFVGGTWVSENERLLKRIFDDGHEIGSHGFKHKEHGKLSYTDNLTEIQVCHELVKTKLGVEMELFAPPGGSYNSSTINAAQFLGYKTIMWTRDTIDWRDHDTSVIYNRAVTNMCGGDLILMHPTKNTAEALENIILWAKKQGFELVTVSKTLGFD